MDSLSSVVYVKETLHSVEALAEFLLLEHVDPQDVEILKREAITGQTLTDLTEDDLRELKLKMGTRKRLMQLIRATKENSVSVEVVKQSTPMSSFSQEIEIIPSHQSTTKRSISSFQEQQSTPMISFSPEIEITPSRPSTKRSISKFQEPISAADILEQISTTDFPEQISTDFQEIIPEYAFDEEVNVKGWLEEHPEGKKLIPILEEGTYASNHRTAMVRIVVAKMVSLWGDAYPSNEIKEKVARGIIKAFPALQSQTLSDGHLSFYDPDTRNGFLEFRLKTIRKKLSPSNKKRKRASQAKHARAPKMPCLQNLLSEEDLQEKILWMQHMVPDEQSKMEIINALTVTMPNRQMEIQTCYESITDILLRYPRLMDYKGEMIDREYIALYPSDDTFLERFTTEYVPRIIKYLNFNRPDLLDTLEVEDNLKALILLPEILPASNYGRGKKDSGTKTVVTLNTYKRKKIPNPGLLKIVKDISDAEDLLSTTISEESCDTEQPFLIMSKTITQQKFFIKIDGTLFEVSDDPIKAFDTLFKIHYVFQAQYATGLKNFYDFIESCVLNMHRPRACCDALNTSLMNIKL